MADWAITLDRSLPIREFAWDAGPAKARIFARATNAAGEFDQATAADAFLLGKMTGLKGDLSLPVADVVDGEMVISAAALRAARSRLGQGYPLDVPKDKRDAANELAGKLLAEFNERTDAAPASDSIWVGLSIPPAVVADQWPPEFDQPPHVTMAYVGPGTQGQADQIAGIVAEVMAGLGEARVELRGLDYFDNADARVAHAKVNVPESIREAQASILKRVKAAGIEVKHRDGAWVPHATLAYLEPGEGYTGTIPAGAWPIEAIEVWRGGVDRIVVSDGRMDRLANRGGKWQALSMAGEVLGEYGTEAEARERLRQIEAAKAARADADAWDWAECRTVADACGVDLSDIEPRADRSDEDKADIRKRWQSDGPNMGAAAMRKWLESPFAGPNRKAGEERARARRVANRALRLMEKPPADWTDADYTGALQVLAFIERMTKVEQGEPLKVDGREGPSARDASLRDWGYDPRKDRSDAKPLDMVQQQAAIVDFLTLVNMSAGDVKRWRDSPFAGEHRYSYKKADVAEVAGDRVLALLAKDIQAWDDADFADAVASVSEISRLLAKPVGNPLEIDGRTGPSQRDADLMDRGHDPSKDDVRVDARQDALGQWEWRTQKDGKVRPSHQALQGVRFDFDDAHPSEGQPGSAYGCRCYPVLVPRRGTKREASAIERAAKYAQAYALSRWATEDDVRADRSDRRAPAVHTESKNAIDEWRFDAAQLLPAEDLANGWKRYPVLYSKAGNVQDYPHLGISEFRPHEAVFDPESLALYVGMPWESPHSPELLTRETVRGVARGTVLTAEPHPDGEHTCGHAIAWDGDLITGIDSGELAEQSVAFRVRAIREIGRSPSGVPYNSRVLKIIPNSLAAVPRGRAETTRVITERLDAAAGVTVRTATELLEIARRGNRATFPIFYDYDLRTWHNRADARTDQKDTIQMKLLEMMLAKHGKSLADLVAALGIAEADLAKVIEEPETLAKIDKYIGSLMPTMVESESMDMAGKVKIGDKEFEVDPAVAAYIAKLEEGKEMEAGRADRADAARVKAELASKERQDAMSTMVSRQDAAKMAHEQALAAGRVLALHERIFGTNAPEPRQDAAGAALPLELSDYKRHIITAVYGDDAKATLDRLDARAPEIRDALLDEHLVNAERIHAESRHTDKPTQASIVRLRTSSAEKRQDAARDPIVDLKGAQSNPKPAASTGA